MVDSETVIAIGFFDDGGLSIVTGGKRRYIDYLLAFRLVLYQLKKPAGLNRLRTFRNRAPLQRLMCRCKTLFRAACFTFIGQDCQR